MKRYLSTLLLALIMGMLSPIGTPDAEAQRSERELPIRIKGKDSDKPLVRILKADDAVPKITDLPVKLSFEKWRQGGYRLQLQGIRSVGIRLGLSGDILTKPPSAIWTNVDKNDFDGKIVVGWLPPATETQYLIDVELGSYEVIEYKVHKFAKGSQTSYGGFAASGTLSGNGVQHLLVLTAFNGKDSVQHDYIGVSIEVDGTHPISFFGVTISRVPKD